MRLKNIKIAACLATIGVLASGAPRSAEARDAADVARHAVIIGISDYANVRDLEGPGQDAQAMADALGRHWGFADHNTTVLTDADATRGAILEALYSLPGRVRAGDQVVLYFSGHGTSRLDATMAYPLPHTTGAIIAHDFPASGDPAGRLDALIVGRSDLKPVLQRLDALGAWTTVIIDSCYSGNIVRSELPDVALDTRHLPLMPRTRTLRFMPPTRSGEAPDYPYERVMLISAASDYEAATDIGARLVSRFPTFDLKPHGAFTDAVLRVLNGLLPADLNRDGAITNGELYHAIASFMNHRGYPHRPRRLPGIDHQLSGLGQARLFGSERIPEAMAGIRRAPLRVLLSAVGDPLGAALRSPGDEDDGLVLVEDGPADLVIVRVADGVRLLTGAGMGIADVPDDDAGTVVETIRRLGWAHQLLQSAAESGGALALDTQPDRMFVLAGEALGLRVSAGQPGYPVVLNIDPAGRVNLLYPHNLEASHRRLDAGDVLTLPRDRTPPITITAPYGSEHILAVLFDTRPAGIEALIGASDMDAASPLRSSVERLLDEARESGAASTLRVLTMERAFYTAWAE